VSSKYLAQNSQVQIGKVQIELRFDEQLQEPVTLLAYAQFQSAIQVDSSRNVHVNVGA
jgi:hypothetical protein